VKFSEKIFKNVYTVFSIQKANLPNNDSRLGMRLFLDQFGN